ncbi:MAG: hypothetical protein P8R54_25345 [Myxococcota bacterium]|nr:hypothetical protein [Myxococcota bacterium]
MLALKKDQRRQRSTAKKQVRKRDVERLQRALQGKPDDVSG